MARSTAAKANIIQILRELCDEDFKVLKTSLAEHQRLPKHIPYVQLEKLDRVDTSNKMKKTYGAEKAWNMIMVVLEDIDMGVLEKFQNVEDSEGEQTSRDRKTEKKKQRSSQKPAPARRSGSSKVHHDVICEGCEESIIGTRYQCTRCPDYDLCSDCHSNGHHKKHPMLAMQDPVQAAEMEKAFRQGRSSSSKVHHGVICEGCEESIIGTRFQCTLCPDYDLCSDCQSAGRHKKHPMLAMQVAEMEEAFHQAPSNRASPRGSSSSKVNHGVICEGCEESIIGTRFKCTLCPDYDLCSDCQSAGRHKKHPLLAIQDPAQAAEMEKAFHQEKKEKKEESPKPAVKPAPPCRPDPSKVHQGVVCDGCEGNIIGTRYKCTVCPDYDLCTDCQATGLHEEHPLLATRPPPKKVHRGVFCDGCGGSISGTRFKCTVCPDYDLCTDCQSTGLHEEHPLLATRPPTKEEEEEKERKFELQLKLLMLEEQALMNPELRQCKALFEYLPKVSDEDELEFNTGDIINIIAKIDDEWWLGSVNGKTGIFPSIYVKELDPSGKDVRLSDAPGDKEELEDSGKDVGLSDAPGDKEGEDSDSGDDDDTSDDDNSEDSSEEEPEIPGEDWIPSQWLDIFDDMVGKLDSKDHWSLSFDERLKLKVSKEEEKKGWTIYGRHSSAMFHCCSCSKKWNPGKVVVVFKYRLLSDTRRGTAVMRCFGQACECSPDELIRPGFSDEEVKKNLCRLFESIQNDDDDDDDDDFDEEAVTPHKKTLCEACQEHICIN